MRLKLARTPHNMFMRARLIVRYGTRTLLRDHPVAFFLIMLGCWILHRSGPRDWGRGYQLRGQDFEYLLPDEYTSRFLSDPPCSVEGTP